MGETLRRLTGKCLCTLLKGKFSSFFQPFQFGVACNAGVEKVIHSLRHCIEAYWQHGDFVVFKVDMSNAFNLVSRQVVLEECATFFSRAHAVGILVLWQSHIFVSPSNQDLVSVRGTTG